MKILDSALTQELWIILIKFWDISNRTKTRNFTLLPHWGPFIIFNIIWHKKDCCLDFNEVDMAQKVF